MRIFVTVLLVVGAGVAAVGARGADPPAAPTITSGPDSPTNSQTAVFEWDVQEGLTYQCQLDEAPFAPCVSPYFSDPLSQGTYVFQVKAVDGSGIESQPASYTWTIDLTAPATPVLRSPRPEDPSNDPTPRFRWDAVLGVTYVCSVDGVAEACIPFYETDPLSEGPHTFELRAKDAAGNLSAPATWNWTVDLTAPDNVSGTAERPPDANGWYNHAVTVAFTSSDSAATCTSAPYSGPDSGSASVTGTCTDPANNSAEATFALKYDATAPTNVTGAPTGIPTNGWYTSPVLVTFAGSDATSGIQSCTAATYSGPDGTGISVEGTCTDNAANASTPAFSSTFKYDATAPEVGLTAPANGSATSDTTPRFTGTTNNGPADLNSVTVSLSGPSPITLVVPVAADGSWSVSPANQLAVGDYQVHATQTDEVGRSDSSPVHTFTIDPALPGVQISSPAHGTVTTDTSLPITGTAGVGASFEPVVNVSIYSGTSTAGTPLLELSAPRLSGDWSTISSPLADGVYTLVAEQSDLAGGTASDSVAVEIDTIPPAPLTGATAISAYGYVKLHWSRPLAWESTDKIIITKRRLGSSTVRTVYQGAGTLFKDGRVQNGETYIYTVIPRDAAGNNGDSLTKRARPTGFLAPRHGANVLDPPLVRWVDVARSTYANIQLYRITSSGLKKIWSVWPTADRLQLKSRWVYKGRAYRLRAGGHYRVYGWPGFGALSERDYREWFGWIDFTYR
jgi:Bacterial Ig-like domain